MFCRLDVIAVLSLDYDTVFKQTRCRAQTLLRRRAATAGDRHGLATAAYVAQRTTTPCVSELGATSRLGVRGRGGAGSQLDVCSR
jgi:hypothetical protein